MSTKDKAKAFMFVCFGVAALACQVKAADIEVINPSFEDYIVGEGAFTWHGEGLIAEGWEVEEGAAVGVFHPTQTAFTSVPDGVNTAYSHGPTIAQVLSAVVEDGVAYTLTVEVGNPANIGGFPGYRIELWAGASLLVADDNTLFPAPGEWLTSTVEYTSPPGDSHAGQLLEIRLLSLGAEVNFDLVQLEDTVGVTAEGKSWGNVRALYR